MKAIKTTNLTRKFNDKTVVNNLDLTVEKGECFALLGLNGAGKTTTIKMLCGLLSPTSGDALMLGDSIVNDLQSVKNKINVSPQETAIAPNLTVKENLEFIAGIYGCDSKEGKQKAEELINSFGLAEYSKVRAKKLSGGMKRRLSIAMALISEPEIVFLDEPTLGLDVVSRRELWNMLKSLKGKITMIITTHYLEEAESLSDRIGIIKDGNLVAVGTATQLKEQTQKSSFEDAFLNITGVEV